MNAQFISIPTINDNKDDFNTLFKFYNQIDASNSWTEKIFFDFSSCKFLRPNAVAFLGGIARLVEFSGGKVTFDWKLIKENIYTNLCKNNFADSFDAPNTLSCGNAMRYLIEKINIVIEMVLQII